MVEFLSDFVIQCLQKDLCDILGESPSVLQDDLKVQDSIHHSTKNDDRIMKYMGDQQIGKFIKKTLKIYKALRVLEKSKSNETP